MSFTKEEQEAAIEEEKRIREEKKRLKAEGIIESTMALLPFSVQTFRANNLVGLRLSGRKIMQLWESGERKPLKKLRFLHLNYSKLRTLDLGMTPDLKILELKECQDLEKVSHRRRWRNLLLHNICESHASTHRLRSQSTENCLKRCCLGCCNFAWFC